MGGWGSEAVVAGPGWVRGNGWARGGRWICKCGCGWVCVGEGWVGMMRGGGWVSFGDVWVGDVCVGEEWVVVWGCWFGFLGGWLAGRLGGACVSVHF